MGTRSGMEVGDGWEEAVRSQKHSVPLTVPFPAALISLPLSWILNPLLWNQAMKEQSNHLLLIIIIN